MWTCVSASALPYNCGPPAGQSSLPHSKKLLRNSSRNVTKTVRCQYDIQRSDPRVPMWLRIHGMSQKKSEPWIGPLVVSWDVWQHELAVDPLSHVGCEVWPLWILFLPSDSRMLDWIQGIWSSGWRLELFDMFLGSFLSSFCRLSSGWGATGVAMRRWVGMSMVS